ncbi:ABC transporter permease [Tengunoibacter tsumagoiensis]|uniref:ABC transporter permease n=1 Tax=Tengunoibacter tsumagoiensis TaxID=2014871 RepID=A0A402A150_9CHLR|nr:ABC transporter permease [Tengunoibacter tsumagoiensis]GCE12779.1 ABC transporter permease [Tengunoibacter tsumagoiensis]
MRISVSPPGVVARAQRVPNWLRYLAIAIGLLVIWQLYVTFSGVDSLVFASPLATLQTLIADVKDGQLPTATVASLQNLVIGMALGIIGGLILASISTFSRFGRDILTVFTALLSPLPGIAILPLTMIWFGLSPAAIIFVVVHSALWPIAGNTDTGFRTIGSTTRMVALNLGLSRWRTITDVYLPAAMPHLLSGLRLAWAFGWRTVVGAEVVFGVAGSAGGLGWYIDNARYFLNPPAIFAGLVVISLLGMLLDAFFLWVERKTVVKWGMKQS